MKEPKIRFKGFREEWETHALSEYFKKVCDKNTKMECTTVLTNSAEYGIIPQNDFFDHAIANNKNIGGYYIVSPNDFVYNPRVSVTAPVGPINRSLLDFQGVMSPLYLVFKINTINKDYLNIFYKTNKWHTFMKLEGNCGARFDRLSISDDQFVKMPLTHPKDHYEQQSIASYFQHLDSLIQSTTKKIESLKQVKAASLQSMFPQEGETTPRVRFKGFEGEWEKVKIQDICSKANSTHSENSLGENIGIYPIFGANGYLQNITTFDFSFPYIGIIKDGSGVGRSQLYPAFSSILGTMQYILQKGDINISFLAYLFETIDFSMYINGSSIPHIYFKDYCEQDEYIPSIAEQRAIASYFTTLDRQINLLSQQLEKLKQIKAACLDEMFV